MSPLRIIFMGSPEFALPSLERIFNGPDILAGIVTQPDSKQGRGRKSRSTPVGIWANEHSIDLYQPENVSDKNFYQWLISKNADIFVIIGFSILPVKIFELPPYGSWNLHASLLPKYRGAAPIQHAILNDEKESGVTFFKLVKKVDAGNYLLKQSVPIPQNADTGWLHDQLSILGAAVVSESLDIIRKGDFILQQQTGKATRAPKIFRNDREINWQQPARDIHNRIRAMSPFPGAITKIDNKEIKLLISEIGSDLPQETAPGTVNCTRDCIRIATADKWLFIRKLQPSGKRVMDVSEFLCGNKL